MDSTPTNSPTNTDVIPSTKQRKTSWYWTFLLLLLCFSWMSMAIFLHHRPRKMVVPEVQTFPSVDESYEYYEHFDRTLRPYTILRLANRAMAGPNYLNSSRSTTEERRALRWFINDYLNFHKRNRYNGTRYLIYIPLRAGMGDRTDCLLHAYWMAVISNRVFLVDWQHPFPLQDLLDNASPGVNLFYDANRDAKRGISARDERNSAFVQFMNGTSHDNDWDEALLMSKVRTVVAKRQRQPRMLSEDLLSFAKPEGVSTMLTSNWRGNPSLRRAIFHHAFRVSDGARRSQMNLTKSLGLNGKLVYVAVHARLGIGVGEPLGRFGKISVKQRRAAKCLASRAVRVSLMTGIPTPPVFLATDTPAFRETFRMAVREMSAGRVKVVSGEWDVVHSNKMTPIADEEPEVKDERLIRVIWGSYMDLLVMGHARHIVGLYSSFPRLAFALGDAETLTELRNEICLDVDRWQ